MDIIWFETLMHKGVFKEPQYIKWPNFGSIYNIDKYINSKELRISFRHILLHTNISTIKFLETNIADYKVLGQVFIYDSDKIILRGLIIQNLYKEIITIVRNTLKIWNYSTEEFTDWINQFHRERLNLENIKSYQLQKSQVLSLPPLWLKYSRDDIEKIIKIIIQEGYESPKDIISIVYAVVPAEIAEQMKKIPAETEILIMNVFYTIGKNIDLSKDLLDMLYEVFEYIFPNGERLIIYNIILYKLLNKIKINNEILDIIKKYNNNTNYEKILFVKIFANYYYNVNKYKQSEKYYRELINLAIHGSWQPDHDIIMAYMGLSNIFNNRGNYIQAYTMKAFSKSFIIRSASNELLVKINQHLEIDTMNAGLQQLNAAIYKINFEEINKYAIILLLDGLYTIISLFEKNELSYFEMIKKNTKNVMFAAINLLYENRDLDFVKTLPDNFYTEIAKFLEIIYSSESHRSFTQIAKKINAFIDDQLLKDRKIITVVSVFHKDGRHISDFYLRDNKLVSVSEGNAVLYSSAIAAVNMFLQEATKSETGIKEIEVGKYKIIFEEGKNILLATHITRDNYKIKEMLADIVNNIETTYSIALDNWNGNLTTFNELYLEIQPLKPYFIESRN